MIVLIVVGLIGLMVVSTIFNGYALSILWGWFFVPTLGLPELSVVQAIGITLVISYLTYQHIDTEEKEESPGNKITNAFVLAIIRPAFAIFFGWIIHSFM